MELALYGRAEECGTVRALLERRDGFRSHRPVLRRWENYDTFIREYAGADALLVLADGGEGLEVMNAAAALAPEVPRVWFASDGQLGPQAVRMGAAFFAPKPVDEETLLRALRRCGITENRAETARVEETAARQCPPSEREEQKK